MASFPRSSGEGRRNSGGSIEQLIVRPSFSSLLQKPVSESISRRSGNITTTMELSPSMLLNPVQSSNFRPSIETSIYASLPSLATCTLRTSSSLENFSNHNSNLNDSDQKRCVLSSSADVRPSMTIQTFKAARVEGSLTTPSTSPASALIMSDIVSMQIVANEAEATAIVLREQLENEIQARLATESGLKAAQKQIITLMESVRQHQSLGISEAATVEAYTTLAERFSALQFELLASKTETFEAAAEVTERDVELQKQAKRHKEELSKLEEEMKIQREENRKEMEAAINNHQKELKDLFEKGAVRVSMLEASLALFESEKDKTDSEWEDKVADLYKDLEEANLSIQDLRAELDVYKVAQGNAKISVKTSKSTGHPLDRSDELVISTSKSGHHINYERDDHIIYNNRLDHPPGNDDVTQSYKQTIEKLQLELKAFKTAAEAQASAAAEEISLWKNRALRVRQEAVILLGQRDELRKKLDSFMTASSSELIPPMRGAHEGIANYPIGRLEMPPNPEISNRSGTLPSNYPQQEILNSGGYRGEMHEQSPTFHRPSGGRAYSKNVKSTNNVADSTRDMINDDEAPNDSINNRPHRLIATHPNLGSHPPPPVSTPSPPHAPLSLSASSNNKNNYTGSDSSDNYKNNACNNINISNKSSIINTGIAIRNSVVKNFSNSTSRFPNPHAMSSRSDGAQENPERGNFSPSNPDPVQRQTPLSFTPSSSHFKAPIEQDSNTSASAPNYGRFLYPNPDSESINYGDKQSMESGGFKDDLGVTPTTSTSGRGGGKSKKKGGGRSGGNETNSGVKKGIKRKAVPSFLSSNEHHSFHASQNEFAI